METWVSYNNIILSLVEREPMWDGNVQVVVCQFLDLCVEREPMWDGNTLCLCTVSQLVSS